MFFWIKFSPIKLNNQAKFWRQRQQAKGLRASNLHNATMPSWKSVFTSQVREKLIPFLWTEDIQSSHWLEKNLLLNKGFDYNSMKKICCLSVKSQWCTLNNLSHKFSWLIHMVKRSLSINLPALKTLQTTLWSLEWRFISTGMHFLK